MDEQQIADLIAAVNDIKPGVDPYNPRPIGCPYWHAHNRLWRERQISERTNLPRTFVRRTVLGELS